LSDQGSSTGQTSVEKWKQVKKNLPLRLLIDTAIVNE
jgi:hypothetical protein